MNDRVSRDHLWLPRTRQCFVCGVENADGFRLRLRVENGAVMTEYETSSSDSGYRGIVHGGIAMTLMDEAMTWAAILATRAVCVAAEITTRFRRPMSVGSRYRIEGRTVRCDRRLVITEGLVLGPDGEEVASSAGKYIPRRDVGVAAAEIEFAESVPPELGLQLASGP